MTAAKIVLPAGLLFLAGEYAIYRKAFCVNREKCADARRPLKDEQQEVYAEEVAALIEQTLARPFEPVTIRADDGTALYGKFYSAGEGAPIQIMMHGYKSVGERDFCGGLNLALENGCSVLLIDQRGHGKSGGKCLTMGVKERLDCVKWAEYLAESFPECKIILTGMSMGAATVLMAAGLRLPENVKGIIADCGYTSPEAIIKDMLRKMGFKTGLAYALVRLSARLFAGFDPRACGAAQALRAAKVPVLLLHGEDDRFVPCEMGRENFEACAARKALLTFPGAGHGLSYMLDTARYQNAVLQFMDDVLINEEQTNAQNTTR